MAETDDTRPVDTRPVDTRPVLNPSGETLRIAKVLGAHLEGGYDQESGCYVCLGCDYTQAVDPDDPSWDSYTSEITGWDPGVVDDLVEMGNSDNIALQVAHLAHVADELLRAGTTAVVLADIASRYYGAEGRHE